MLQSGGGLKKNLNFHVFISSTLIWKNNSIWVERRQITIGESQKRKANNNNDDENSRSIIVVIFKDNNNNDDEKKLNY